MMVQLQDWNPVDGLFEIRDHLTVFERGLVVEIYHHKTTGLEYIHSRWLGMRFLNHQQSESPFFTIWTIFQVLYAWICFFCLRIRSHDSSPFCTTIWEKIFVVFFTNHLTSEFKTWEFFGAVVVGWLIGWLVGWFVGWLSQHSLEPSIVRVFYMSCPILGWVLGSITLNRGLKVMLIHWGHSIANLVLQKEATSTRWSSCEPPQFCHNDSCLRIASGGRTVGWKVWNRVNVTSNLWSLLQLSLKQPTWLLLFGNIWDMFLWHHSCIFFREFCHHVILGRFQIFSFLGHFSKKKHASQKKETFVSKRTRVRSSHGCQIGPSQVTWLSASQSGVEKIILLLMAEIRRENQLRLVVEPIIYRVYTSKRWFFGISSINSNAGFVCHVPRSVFRGFAEDHPFNGGVSKWW